MSHARLIFAYIFGARMTYLQRGQRRAGVARGIAQLLLQRGYRGVVCGRGLACRLQGRLHLLGRRRALGRRGVRGGVQLRGAVAELAGQPLDIILRVRVQLIGHARNNM